MKAVKRYVEIIEVYEKEILGTGMVKKWVTAFKDSPSVSILLRFKKGMCHKIAQNFYSIHLNLSHINTTYYI